VLADEGDVGVPLELRAGLPLRLHVDRARLSSFTAATDSGAAPAATAASDLRLAAADDDVGRAGEAEGRTGSLTAVVEPAAELLLLLLTVAGLFAGSCGAGDWAAGGAAAAVVAC
jgi:hypothetical protein